MSDFISGCGLSLSDAERAERVLDKFSDEDGFTLAEGESLGFIDMQRIALSNVLTKRETESEGVVSQVERSTLTMAGFSQTFVQALAGDNGNKPLETRARFFTDKLFDFGFISKYVSRPDRYKILDQIEGFGPEAIAFSSKQALIALKDADAEVRSWAFDYLAKAEPTEEITKAALAAVKDVDEGVRYEAVQVLEKAKPSKAIEQVALTVLKDTDEDVRYWAQRYLRKAEPSEAITEAAYTAVKEVEDDDDAWAFEYIEKVEPTKEITKAVWNAAKYNRGAVRNWAFEYIEKVESTEASTAEALYAMVDADEDVRGRALYVLTSKPLKGTPSSEIIKVALEVLNQVSSPYSKDLRWRTIQREKAVEILKKIKSPTSEITAAIHKYEEEITKEKPE